MLEVRSVEKQHTARPGRRPDPGIRIGSITDGGMDRLPGIRGGPVCARECRSAFELFQAVSHGPGQGEPELLGLGGWHGCPQWAAGWRRDQYRSRAPDFTGMLSLSLGLELTGLGLGIGCGSRSLWFLLVNWPRRGEAATAMPESDGCRGGSDCQSGCWMLAMRA